MKICMYVLPAVLLALPGCSANASADKGIEACRLVASSITSRKNDSKRTATVGNGKIVGNEAKLSIKIEQPGQAAQYIDFSCAFAMSREPTEKDKSFHLTRIIMDDGRNQQEFSPQKYDAYVDKSASLIRALQDKSLWGISPDDTELKAPSAASPS